MKKDEIVQDYPEFSAGRPNTMPNSARFVNNSDNSNFKDRLCGIRCNNTVALLSAETISIHDGYEFDRIVDVMNGVFRGNYGPCMKGFYYLNSSKTIGAWFPKMAVVKNGLESAQSSTKDWINTLSNDGKQIRMYTNNPSTPGTWDGRHAQHITFAKFAGEPYKYIGTFLGRDDPSAMDHLFDRISTPFILRTACDRRHRLSQN